MAKNFDDIVDEHNEALKKGGKALKKGGKNARPILKKVLIFIGIAISINFLYYSYSFDECIKFYRWDTNQGCSLSFFDYFLPTKDYMEVSPVDSKRFKKFTGLQPIGYPISLLAFIILEYIVPTYFKKS